MIALSVAFGALVAPARAQDPDNCLYCHQYPGLSRLDDNTGTVRLFFVDPTYTHSKLGPHARLACTDCHQRSETGVVPHKTVSPVDCLRQCHITRPDAPERRFSHAAIGRMLEQSAHKPDALTQARLDGAAPLAPNQSICLNCHDEPVFRTDHVPIEPGATARCEVCHDTQMPLDDDYMLKHVSARLRPARPSLELAQVCSVCHSDPRFLASIGKEDPVASYARSFHGKAVLLGDQTSANCIDCHVGSGQNVHLMLGPKDPASSVHPNHVADSCIRCHTDASVSIAATAVHLDIPRSVGSIDYLIAAMFILVTVCTYLPSALLMILELGQIVVARHHHSMPGLIALVERIENHPLGRRRLTRFKPIQRIQHWLLTILFILLCLTGFPLKFADHHWAATVIDWFGGIGVARQVHHWSGLCLLIGFGLHVLTNITRGISRGRKSGGGGVVNALLNLPMVMSPADLRKTGELLAYLLGLRKERPTFGRFSASEKFEYFGVLWGTTLLGLTGLMLWFEQHVSHWLGGRAFNIATVLHTYEAFLAVIHVGILHICGVILVPRVFPLSLATITGRTPPEKLAEENADFVTGVARDLGLDADTNAAGVHHG